mmetsp:Transcript_147487/g.257837  ORF Transcript_147487/g.257837 Transcript_147487/m.257837 type:complete len:214 (-) Transcript_147487:1664-2305(-)
MSSRSWIRSRSTALILFPSRAIFVTDAFPPNSRLSRRASAPMSVMPLSFSSSAFRVRLAGMARARARAPVSVRQIPDKSIVVMFWFTSIRWATDTAPVSEDSLKRSTSLWHTVFLSRAWQTTCMAESFSPLLLKSTTKCASSPRCRLGISVFNPGGQALRMQSSEICCSIGSDSLLLASPKNFRQVLTCNACSRSAAPLSVIQLWSRLMDATE